MGLLRALNPLCGNVTAPRHRQARALEALVRAERDRVRDENRATIAAMAAASAEASAPVVTLTERFGLDDHAPRWGQDVADQIMSMHAEVAALKAAGDEAGKHAKIAQVEAFLAEQTARLA